MRDGKWVDGGTPGGSLNNQRIMAEAGSAIRPQSPKSELWLASLLQRLPRSYKEQCNDDDYQCDGSIQDCGVSLSQSADPFGVRLAVLPKVTGELAHCEANVLSCVPRSNAQDGGHRRGGVAHSSKPEDGCAQCRDKLEGGIERRGGRHDYAQSGEIRNTACGQEGRRGRHDRDGNWRDSADGDELGLPVLLRSASIAISSRRRSYACRRIVSSAHGPISDNAFSPFLDEPTVGGSRVGQILSRSQKPRARKRGSRGGAISSGAIARLPELLGTRACPEAKATARWD